MHAPDAIFLFKKKKLISIAINLNGTCICMRNDAWDLNRYIDIGSYSNVRIDLVYVCAVAQIVCCNY